MRTCPATSPSERRSTCIRSSIPKAQQWEMERSRRAQRPFSLCLRGNGKEIFTAHLHPEAGSTKRKLTATCHLRRLADRDCGSALRTSCVRLPNFFEATATIRLTQLNVPYSETRHLTRVKMGLSFDIALTPVAAQDAATINCFLSAAPDAAKCIVFC